MKNDFDLQELIKRNTLRKTLELTRIEKDFMYTQFLCPNCKTSLIKAKKQNYCDECGQRLDWRGY